MITANWGNGGAGNNTLTVLTNDGSGGFALNATLTVGHGAAWVAAADVNGDGSMDLISANSGDNTLTVLTNNGSGIFTLAATIAVGALPFCVTAADVNRDGRLDLITANRTANTLSVVTNTPAVQTNFGTVVISWSTNAAGFTLQQNSNLATTNWTSVTTAPSVANGENVLRLPPDGGGKFYRLKSR